MKFDFGDKVEHIKSSYIGKITDLKIRGVAGADTTYVDWIEVTCTNGIIIKSDPSFFKLAKHG